MSKKTVPVDQVKKFVNSWLSSDAFSQEEKKGMIATLETILHATGNYHGFTYVNMTKDSDGAYQILPNTEYSRIYD